MSTLEWIATVLGVACVMLAAVRSIWTFPTAIGSVVLLGFVVFEARLYSDALLQGFFVAANVYGWWAWRRAGDDEGDILVARMSRYSRAVWTAGWAIATIAWGTAMHTLTDAAYPWWDAGIAAASIIAQLLMARRKIENWQIWIVVDLASIPLYLVKGLYLFAGLYVIYLGLAVWGLVGWRRAALRPAALPAAA